MKASRVFENVGAFIVGVLMVIVFIAIMIPAFCFLVLYATFVILSSILFTPPGFIVISLLAIIYLIFTGGCL